MKRGYWLVFMLLIVAMLVPALTVQAQDSLSQTYTALDGSVSVSYPEGWVVQEEGEQMMLGTSEAVFDKKVYDPDDAELLVGTPSFTQNFMVATGSFDLASFMKNMASLFEDQNEGLVVTEVEEITVGDNRAWAFEGSSPQADLIIIAFNAAPNTPVFIFAVTAPSHLADFKDTFLSISATITKGSGTPGQTTTQADADPSASENAPGINTIAYSPDGSRIATGSADYTVTLWDAAAGSPVQTLAGHSGPVYSVAFSPDGTKLASGGADKTIRIWDPATGESSRTLTIQSPVHSLAFAPDSRMIMVGDDTGNIRIIDTMTSFPVQMMRGYSDAITGVAVSPDGTLIASASRAENAIKLWDAKTGGLVQTIKTPDAVVTVAFSSDGTLLVSGSQLGGVDIWDVETGVLLLMLPGPSNLVTQVVFSPDGALIAAGSIDNKIYLWDSQTGKLIQSFAGSINDIDFSPDGLHIASGGEDPTIRIWDVPGQSTSGTLTEGAFPLTGQGTSKP